jgi:hypothetical protein
VKTSDVIFSEEMETGLQWNGVFLSIYETSTVLLVLSKFSPSPDILFIVFLCLHADNQSLLISVLPGYTKVHTNFVVLDLYL